MPPKSTPKFFQLLLKTHKLTIFLTVPQLTTIASLKQDALSALATEAAAESETGANMDADVESIPAVSSVDDFEICRAVKEKGRVLAGEYEVLDHALAVKDVSGIVNWEVLYIQFKDDSGNLLPVEFTEPSLTYDDEDDARPSTLSQALPESGRSPHLMTDSVPSTSAGKNKRKAPEF